MFFDNLTVAGLLIAAPYMLLPLFFGREFLGVADEGSDQRAKARRVEVPQTADHAAPATVEAAPCH
ncbi:MAG: hypothetical protein GVY09_03060 [Gammaproteobacteria bacterium]|jgi:hypothetical protein|nr:hypothetical protein [Gammaproteobacteria bacterium]